MGDTVNSGTNSRLQRNLTVGLLGILTAVVFLYFVIRYQAYLPGYIVKSALCVFPVPVAFGLATGLVSPRRAIAWAPLWSGVFSLLVIAVVSTAITRAPINPSERIAWAAAGALIGAGLGIVGQLLAARSYAGRSVLAFMLSCCVLAVILGGLLRNQMAAFVDNSVPQILEEVDKDIIELPSDMKWQCLRDVAHGMYVLTSSLDGKPIRIYAIPDPAGAEHIDYSSQLACSANQDQAAVQQCLMNAGLREELLLGLTREDSGRWITAFRGTQMTLDAQGYLQLSAAALPMRSVDSKRPL
ncbi:MAG: hypothetical protein GX139_07040 [Armatimonadetes bacterium]|jgi:hypothetical protein|nr:hypothetical protein [Armatimonadota bacterium]